MGRNAQTTVEGKDQNSLASFSSSYAQASPQKERKKNNRKIQAMAPTPPNSKAVSVPILLTAIAATSALIFFTFLPSLSSSICSCPRRHHHPAPVQKTSVYSRPSPPPLTTAPADISWVKDQLRLNGIPDPPSTRQAWHSLRKGINPRTREQQLEDFRRYKGISHYEDPDEAKSHTAFPCPGELLVEEHHSNYGEPWAGGRDVFEFIAGTTNLSPDAQVLEIGCGTLRVGLHFIRYLNPGKFHCLERDNLSIMAALGYEIPSQGLLYKRPMIVKGEDMDFSRFGSDAMFDLIYASAVFLHMPDNLVWVGLERLSIKLRPYDGRIFVSHNIKFCSRLGGDECTKRLTNLGLEYVGKKTHDSLLFNHYEIWFEFRRSKA